METKSREYMTLHKRLGRKHGKPSYCEHCFSIDTEINYQWAHKHEAPYTDDRTNWFRLCLKCHSKYDISPERRREIGRLGGIATAGKPRVPVSEERKAKISATLKAKGIQPPSQEGHRWKRTGLRGSKIR